MKDYFDVHFLIKNHKIDKKRLKRAIKGFTTHYNGKPTKRYKQIMSEIEQIEKMESWNCYKKVDSKLSQIMQPVEWSPKFGHSVKHIM